MPTLLEQLQASRPSGFVNDLTQGLNQFAAQIEAGQGNVKPLMLLQEQQKEQSLIDQMAQTADKLQGSDRDAFLNAAKLGDVKRAESVLTAGLEKQSTDRKLQGLQARIKRIKDPAVRQSLQAFSGEGDFKSTLAGVRFAENKQLQREQRLKQLQDDFGKEESKRILKQGGEGLKGEDKIRFSAALKRNDLDEASSIIKASKPKPASTAGLIRAAQNKEVDIQDSDSRLQWLQAQGISSSKAEAINDDFEKRFLKNTSFWDFFKPETIKVQMPNGIVEDVNLENLNDKLKQGAQIVQQPLTQPLEEKYPDRAAQIQEARANGWSDEKIEQFLSGK